MLTELKTRNYNTYTYAEGLTKAEKHKIRRDSRKAVQKLLNSQLGQDQKESETNPK